MLSIFVGLDLVVAKYLPMLIDKAQCELCRITFVLACDIDVDDELDIVGCASGFDLKVFGRIALDGTFLSIGLLSCLYKLIL